MTNAYFEGLQERKLRLCQYYKGRPDTVGYCKLDETLCCVERGDLGCEEWKQVQAEWLKEEHEIKPEPTKTYRILKDKRNGG